jgi:hypothetical protein
VSFLELVQGLVGADVGVITDPLLMNAFNNVNLAAAVLLTSTEFARELGIPESKWIYPLGGAGTRDSYECEYISGATIILNLASIADQTQLNSLAASKLPQQPCCLQIARHRLRSVRIEERRC